MTTWGEYIDELEARPRRVKVDWQALENDLRAAFEVGPPAVAVELGRELLAVHTRRGRVREQHPSEAPLLEHARNTERVPA